MLLYRDKRFIIALLLTLTIAGIFWMGQRYPSLNEKAMMNGDIVIEDPLGFRPFLRIDPSASFWKRVLITTELGAYESTWYDIWPFDGSSTHMFTAAVG